MTAVGSEGGRVRAAGEAPPPPPVMPSMVSPGPVRVRVIETATELDRLAAGWEALQKDAALTSVFETHDWQKLWWDNYGRGQPLRVIVASMAANLDQPRACARYNTAFHRRVARLCPNIPLRSFYVTLLDFYEQDLVAAQGMPEVLNPGNAEVHQHLVDAIEARDPAVMATAIRDHETNRLELGVFRPRAQLPVPGALPRLKALPLVKGGSRSCWLPGRAAHAGHGR